LKEKTRGRWEDNIKIDLKHLKKTTFGGRGLDSSGAG
jgi:hypothetical protein